MGNQTDLDPLARVYRFVLTNELPRGLRSSNPNMLTEEFARYEADHPRKPDEEANG